ncbi:ubiquitin carboxyl-terminal hydrolase 2-like [Dendronephthya gigantea]|uniref:ubiquitin carboxyl-terminal hydrolase 2-like n=1 Tax=Dendronephthya gigantea TaxID=151771 RepID=UPI00106D72DA|nr:ubiquitin carboxyl-terminal hydrolase 2-like [Dendronephthya gigantea]
MINRKYESKSGGLNLKRESEERRDLPYLAGRTTMGNTLRSTGGRAPTATGRRHSSALSSVSHKDTLNFENGSDLPQFAGKSSNSTSILSSNYIPRRNSSDSGYNSSGKGYEPRGEPALTNKLQPLNIQDCNKLGKSDYSQLKSHRNFKPETYQGTDTSGCRSRSLDLNYRRSTSYVTDRSMLPRSPTSGSNGLVGLQNLGNTCFMNSILQCLSHCRPLKDKIISCDDSLQHINRHSKMKGKLFCAFSDLIQTMWSKNVTGTEVSPRSFKMQIQRFSPRFVGYEQQDSQEFLRFLLEGINEDLNKAVNASKRSSASQVSPDSTSKRSEKDLSDYMWAQYKLRDESLVTDLFCGQIMSTLRCTKCKHRSVTFDPFWDLSLSIPRVWFVSASNSRFQMLLHSNCLRLFTKKEDLDGDEKPKCEKCKTRQKCEKQIKIHRFPRILVIHLKRFSGFGYRSKLQTDVEFPLNDLDMSEFASECSDECSDRDYSSIKYNLFAVSNHCGSAFGGHYTAYCKHPETKEWHSFNDSRVGSLSSSSVRGSQAYVLFYERNES